MGRRLLPLGLLLLTLAHPEAHPEGPALGAPPKRAKRGFTYPGTLWCGAGNIAGSYDELGEHRETDRCCRDHDNCRHVIHPFDYKYGYRNLRWHTISHCDCDNRLKVCLRSVNDTSSRVVGQAFFNVIRVPCFRFAYKEQCVEPYLYVWCRNYSTVAVAVVQEQALYEYGGEVIDGPSINRPSMTMTPLPRSATPRYQPDVPIVEVTEPPVRRGDSRKNRPEKPVVITNPPVRSSGFGKKQPNKPDVVIPGPAIKPGRPRKNRPDSPVKPRRFGKKQPDGHVKAITNPGDSRKTVGVTDSPVRPSKFSKKQLDERLRVVTDAPVRPDETIVIPDPPMRPNGFKKNQPVLVTDAPVRPDETIVIPDPPIRPNEFEKNQPVLVTDAPVRPDETIVIPEPPVRPNGFKKNQPVLVTDAPVRPDETIVILDPPIRPNEFEKNQPVLLTDAPVQPDETIVILDPPIRPNGFEKNQPVVVTDTTARKNRPDEPPAPVQLNRPEKKHRRGKGKKRKGKKRKGMKKEEKEEKETLQNVPVVLLQDPAKELAAPEPGKIGFQGEALNVEEDPFNAILSDDPGEEVIVPDPVPTVSSTAGPFRKKRKGRRRPGKKDKRLASS
ncbi:protein PROCA1 [Anolis sagrei]|uniref:protein PROCA1 n=1 Tax=Anolis sagrei TaxID=38937 RepID=UPI00351FAFE4